MVVRGQVDATTLQLVLTELTKDLSTSIGDCAKRTVGCKEATRASNTLRKEATHHLVVGLPRDTTLGFFSKR